MALHHLCSAEEWKPELAELGELLIAHGASLDAADNTGATPVLKACEVESHRLVQALCSAGCDVNIPTVNGDSPIQVSLDISHCRTAKEERSKILISMTVIFIFKLF